MKMFYRMILAGLMLVLMAGTVMAKKPRRLAAKVYISSAKIEILGSADDTTRIYTAMAMLDSLFMHHGPHSEAYYWYSQINWEISNNVSDLKSKLPFVTAAVAYADSLKGSCDNDSIKKKYRKNCEKFDEEMDSIRVDQWRHYYNLGVEQITEVEELMVTVKVEEDSASLAYYQGRLDALVDSCQDRMALAIVIDGADPKPYIGIASVNEKIGDFEQAIKFMKMAVPRSDDTCSMKVEVAYDYIRMEDYCGAIPWFKGYVDCMSAREEIMQDPEHRAAILSTAHNLVSCYNNCKQYGEAYATLHQVLSFDPADAKALQGAGRYHQHVGRQASDSASNYRESDEAAATAWQETRDRLFDSSIVYLAQACELRPDDAELQAECALIQAIRQRYEEAQVGFAIACELEPDNVDYWISLGDCELQLHEWVAAAEAYEHVVELTPDKKSVWERLSDLYKQIGGNKERLAEIDAKLQSL